MSRKRREIIKKDVTLITYKGGRRGVEFEVKEFNECGFLNDNHSIYTDDYKYYCKGDEYYYNAFKGYCFIVDQDCKQKALEEFIDALNNMYELSIERHEGEINSLRSTQLEMNNKSNKIK
jgi:hypothetical protein